MLLWLGGRREGEGEGDDGERHFSLLPPASENCYREKCLRLQIGLLSSLSAAAGRDDALRAPEVIGRERSRSEERERAERGGVEDHWPPLSADGLGPFEEETYLLVFSAPLSERAEDGRALTLEREHALEREASSESKPERRCRRRRRRLIGRFTEKEKKKWKRRKRSPFAAQFLRRRRNAVYLDLSHPASSAPGQPPKLSLVESITNTVQNRLHAREEELFFCGERGRARRRDAIDDDIIARSTSTSSSFVFSVRPAAALAPPRAAHHGAKRARPRLGRPRTPRPRAAVPLGLPRRLQRRRRLCPPIKRKRARGPHAAGLAERRGEAAGPAVPAAARGGDRGGGFRPRGRRSGPEQLELGRERTSSSFFDSDSGGRLRSCFSSTPQQACSPHSHPASGPRPCGQPGASKTGRAPSRGAPRFAPRQGALQEESDLGDAAEEGRRRRRRSGPYGESGPGLSRGSVVGGEVEVVGDGQDQPRCAFDFF